MADLLGGAESILRLTEQLRACQSLHDSSFVPNALSGGPSNYEFNQPAGQSLVYTIAESAGRPITLGIHELNGTRRDYNVAGNGIYNFAVNNGMIDAFTAPPPNAGGSTNAGGNPNAGGSTNAGGGTNANSNGFAEMVTCLAEPAGGLTAEQLRKIMPRLSNAKAAALLPHLNSALKEFGITTHGRQAAFLAQIAHESAQLRKWIEGPSKYSGPYFEKYDFKKNIGNRHVGDGFKYRGSGPLQLTGRDNFTKAGKALHLDLVNNPDVVRNSPEVGFRAAGWYWKLHGLNQLADKRNFLEITRRINKAKLGLSDRVQYYLRAIGVLCPDTGSMIAGTESGGTGSSGSGGSNATNQGNGSGATNQGSGNQAQANTWVVVTDDSHHAGSFLPSVYGPYTRDKAIEVGAREVRVIQAGNDPAHYTLFDHRPSSSETAAA